MRRWKIYAVIAVLILVVVAHSHYQSVRILRSYGYTPLHWAALDGDAARAERLLARGADPNAESREGDGYFGPPEGQTPLLLAAEKGRTKVVEILLKHGADPNRADEDGKTPLLLATEKHYAEIVRLLLANSADTNARDKQGFTPLYLAAQDPIDPKLVEFLLEKGARILPADDGRNALHLAACHGSPRDIELLLAHGANVNTRSETGETPLHWAAESSNVEAIKALIAQGANVNAKDDGGYTPLHELPWLHHHPSEQKVLDAAEYLIDHGASVSAMNRCGLTPLDSCARHGNRKVAALLRKHGATSNNIHTLIGEGRLSEVKALLRADPKQVELPEPELGNPPIYTAIYVGDLAAVKVLVEHGANINARKGFNKWTALHAAACYAGPDIVNYLISKGAKIDVVDGGQDTPLHVAVDEGKRDVAEILLRHDADPNFRTEGGWTPLHYAANNGDAKMVRFLENHFADMTREDGMGRTPLFQVMSDSPVGDKMKTAGILIPYVPGPFARDEQGQTPLYEAAKNGRADMVELLLDNGARIHIKDKDGKRPAQYASNAETVRALSRLLSW